VIREFCSRSAQQARPDIGGRKGHSGVSSKCGNLRGGEPTPLSVDKSTLVCPNQSPGKDVPLT
jgi:hypothetical protein